MLTRPRAVGPQQMLVSARREKIESLLWITRESMPHCACHLTFSQRITYDLRITNSLPLFRSDEATILVSQTDRRFRIPGNRLHDFREDSNKLTYEQALIGTSACYVIATTQSLHQMRSA